MLKNDVPLMSEYAGECTFNFNKIEVVVKKYGDMYEIRIDPKDVDLKYENLPKGYKNSGKPRLETSIFGKQWFVLGINGDKDLHFNNSDRFPYNKLEHILFNIKEGSRILTELREDSKIRINLDNIGNTAAFDFNGIKVEVTKECNHLGKCDENCLYSINIDLNKMRKVLSYTVDGAISLPGSRGEFEGTASFTSNGKGNWYVSRYIGGKEGSPSITFANGEMLSKRKVEYILYSIQKNLDIHAKVGTFKKIEEDAASKKEENKLLGAKKEFLTKSSPNFLKVSVKPVDDKYILYVQGMLTKNELPAEYINGDWCCYSTTDGDFIIKKNGFAFVPPGVDINGIYFKSYGTVMTEEAVNRTVDALAKCSQTLYTTNHPDTNVSIIRL